MRLTCIHAPTAFLLLSAALLISCGTKTAGTSEDIALTTTSDEARRLFQKGLDLYDFGDFAGARAMFDQALESDPRFALAAAYRAMSAESAPEWKEYHDRAMSAREGVSPGEEMIIDMLDTYVRDDAQKRYELAKELVNTFPKSRRALMLLAAEQQNMKEFTIARTTLSKVIDVDPSWAPPYRLLALSYLFDEPREFNEAKAFMEKFVELKPDLPASHIGLGDVYRARAELDKARAEYARAVELDPTASAALLKLGHALTFLGQYPAARETFARAAAVATSDVAIQARNYATLTWVYAGDYDAALSAIDEVLVGIGQSDLPEKQLDEQYMYTYQERTVIAMHAGKMDIAVQAADDMATYARSVAETIDVPELRKNVEADILMLQGILAARMGKYAEAMEKAEAMPALLESINNPNKLEGYHAVLGIIHLLEKNYEYAIEHLRQADQSNVYVKYHLALALEGAGKQEEAHKLFKEVAEFNFNSAYYAVIRHDALAQLPS